MPQNKTFGFNFSNVGLVFLKQIPNGLSGFPTFFHLANDYYPKYNACLDKIYMEIIN